MTFRAIANELADTFGELLHAQAPRHEQHRLIWRHAIQRNALRTVVGTQANKFTRRQAHWPHQQHHHDGRYLLPRGHEQRPGRRVHPVHVINDD